ncbi:AI-2E family transporter [Ferrovum sp.]|uniref:AI-2E family transporter n=1 Tax=Ferrovum sp. TaxID=2609467 RepID=UPI002623474D|nr:AI-2E family transporter [Ferrovum sp.]
MPLSRPRFTQRPEIWLALLALGALIYTLADILAPFVAGLLLAYLGHPLVRRLSTSWFPRPLAALVVVGSFLGLGLGFLVLLFPLLAHDLLQLIARLPNTADAWQAALIPYLPRNLGIDWSTSLSTWRELLKQHLGSISDALQNLLLSARHGGSVLIHLFLTLLLIPVVTFYLLKDWDRLIQTLAQKLPPRNAAPLRQLAHEIDVVLGQFLRGQVLVMTCMATFYGLGLHFTGLSSGLALGITAGLLVFIPYVGVFIGFVLAVLTALIQDPSLLLPVCGVFAAGHVLEGSFITPRLVGERIGLHPVMVILALLSFGQLLGFFGIVIALPASAVARVLLGHLHQIWWSRETTP